MNRRDVMWRLLVGISVATAVSGLVQLLAPGFILGLLSAEATPTGRHFFGIVGMFMALFGGMTVQALFSAGDHRIVFLWAAAQKFGAFVAVTLGVMNAIFSSTALLVAGFDLGTAVLMAVYLFSRLPSEAG